MTKVQLCGFNTFLGLAQAWKILECKNPFFIGKVINYESTKKRPYIYFPETHKTTFTNYKDFADNYGLGEIEFLKGFYKKPKCDYCSSENYKLQEGKEFKHLCIDCFNEY